MTNARELLEGTTPGPWPIEMTQRMGPVATVAISSVPVTITADNPADIPLAYAAPDLARQVTQLEAQLAEMRAHIAEQITHAETRIADGDEMGARVWRIALEDIARENRALLHKEPK